MSINGAKCVLVVDDDVWIREAVSEILRLAGYRVEMAGNGEQALAQVSATRPDAIILDLAMPVMDGRTFLQHCRVDPLCSARPVVVISARGDLGEITKELHVHDVLAKPFDLQQLLDTLERALTLSAV